MMNLNKDKVRKHFTRQAHTYDQYAHIQRNLADRLFKLMSDSVGKRPPFQRILEIGCGTGYLTQILVDKYPNAEFVIMDLSEAMMTKTKERLKDQFRSLDIMDAADTASKVTCVIGDAELIASEKQRWMEQPFDLIISNATFQWFNQPQETILAYLNCLAPAGFFAFSTFGPQTFHELHASFQQAEQQLGLTKAQHGQCYMDMNDWDKICTEQTTKVNELDHLHIENYPSVRDFLHSVKNMGAGNAVNMNENSNKKNSKRSNLGGKRLIETMEQYYTDTYKSTLHHNEIKVTYHLYGGVHKKLGNIIKS